jgi:hypothetical protein
MVSSVCSNALTDRQGRARGDPVFLSGLYLAPLPSQTFEDEDEDGHEFEFEFEDDSVTSG